MDTPCQSVRGHLCNTDRVEVIGDCVNCEQSTVGSSHSQDGEYTKSGADPGVWNTGHIPPPPSS